MKLIIISATIAVLSTAAFAATHGSWSVIQHPATTAHSSDQPSGSHGEGYIYGGFGPHNDSR